MNRRYALVAVACLTLLFASATLFAAAEVQEGVVVAAGNGSVAMTDIYGENTRSYLVAPTARITLDGTAAKLEELRMGDHVVVTMRQQDRHMKVAIRVDAHSEGG